LLKKGGYMAKIKKLKNGRYRIEVLAFTEIRNGKRIKHYRTITMDTAVQCREAEKEIRNDPAHKLVSNLTFGDALNRYIQQRTAVLSPSTLNEYKRSLNRDYADIKDIMLLRLTESDLQAFINQYAVNHKPKTVRNANGLISSVMRSFRPNFRYHIDLPQKKQFDGYIPDDVDIQAIIEEAKGTDLEIPILLAAFGPMRRGEISALKYSSIEGNSVHVSKNTVWDGKHWVEKAPKTFSSDRYIIYPQFVIDLIGSGEGYVCKLNNPNCITFRFRNLLKKAGVHKFRFHDLRHYSASIQHAMGIPDIYIMQRGGWKTDGVMKTVYRHALDRESEKMNTKINRYFERLDKKTVQKTVNKLKNVVE
jgi:integrase